MTFDKLYTLIMENTPEFARHAHKRMGYLDKDAVTFIIDSEGTIYTGANKNRDGEFDTMTHGRLMSKHGIKFSSSTRYSLVEGRAWLRDKTLYIVFWTNVTDKEDNFHDAHNIPNDEQMINLIDRLKSKYNEEVVNVLADYGNGWFDPLETTNLKPLSPEKQKLREMEHMLHLADPSQKAFIRKGIEIMRAKLDNINESVIPFDWDDLKNKYSYDGHHHRIDLFNKSGAVGFIEWNEDDGEVNTIHIGEKLRRLGIGGYLWELATDYSNEHSFPPPEHSSRRTKSGDSFAKSIGGTIPELTDDIDGWTSKENQ